MASAQEAGGFDVTFVNEVDEELKCVVCCLVLRDPIQLVNCGHRFCKSCLDRMHEFAQRLNTELICPVDRELIDMQKVFLDKGISRTVGNLKARCSNEGCDKVADLRDLQNHEKSCVYKVNDHSVSSESGPCSFVAMSEVLNRLQQCENNLADKDKEVLQLKYSIKELKEENIVIRQELNSLKEVRKEECVASSEFSMAKEQLQKEISGLREALQYIEGKNADLCQKVGSSVRISGKTNRGEQFTDNLLEDNAKKIVDILVKENVGKAVDSKLSSLRNDVANIKSEASKAVKETRATRSHLDKSLNKKNEEIDALNEKDQIHKQRLNNIENVIFTFDGSTPSTDDIVLKWVVQDFKHVSEVGGVVRSPVFSTRFDGYMLGIVIRFNETKTNFGLGVALHCEHDAPRPLPEFNTAYTITIHSKEGNPEVVKTSLDTIAKYRKAFTVEHGKNIAQGVGRPNSLSRPYDDYIINNCLFVTCTVHVVN